LRYELENLVYDAYVGKVDHPPNVDPVNPVYFKDVSDSLAAASFQLSVHEDLAYEDLLVQAEVSKARGALGDGGEDETEDFYSGLEAGEDFYSGVGAGDVEEPDSGDPVDKLMRDIMS
jgi:hypothetical protein